MGAYVDALFCVRGDGDSTREVCMWMWIFVCVWSWLIGAYVNALFCVRGGEDDTQRGMCIYIHTNIHIHTHTHRPHGQLCRVSCTT